MNLVKSFVSTLIGLAIIVFGVLSFQGADFDPLEFLNSATRSKSGLGMLAIVLMAGCAFLFLGVFYFQMHRARKVDPEIKKFIEDMYD